MILYRDTNERIDADTWLFDVQRSKFLNMLWATGDVQIASKTLKVTRRTAYLWKRASPTFSDAWDSAVEQFRAAQRALVRDRTEIVLRMKNARMVKPGAGNL
jgi:hypothetical protein